MHPQRITRALTLTDVDRFESLFARFWRHVVLSVESDCWLWNGPTALGGALRTMRYGTIAVSVGGKWHNRPAHRIAYLMTHGHIPANTIICHTCDTPTCVNPAHLFAGTDKDNTADMWAKGRARRGVPLRGERNPTAKLTAAQVRDIRALQGTGVTLAAVGRRFGVSYVHIRRIWDREVWRHI